MNKSPEIQFRVTLKMMDSLDRLRNGTNRTAWLQDVLDRFLADNPKPPPYRLPRDQRKAIFHFPLPDDLRSRMDAYREEWGISYLGQVARYAIVWQMRRLTEVVEAERLAQRMVRESRRAVAEMDATP